MPNSDIATAVKAKREKLGLSLRDVAKKAGVLHSAVDRLEHGKEVEASTMIAICRALKVKI